MWQSPNQRTNAAQMSKKLQQERLMRPIHLKRVRAEVRLVPPSDVTGNASTEEKTGELREVRILLNDVSASGIGIYGTEAMTPGQMVKIALMEPQPVNVEARVVWCQDVQTNSRVLSQQSFPFRIGVQIVFKTPEEETAFKAFCEDLEKNHLYAPKV